jgi:predicted component of type VI protein secretion system
VWLLSTGTVSQGMFDFLMGMVRWRYRVAVYVSLMRDEYPPFRLDMGSR